MGMSGMSLVHFPQISYLKKSTNDRSAFKEWYYTLCQNMSVQWFFIIFVPTVA